MRRGRFLATTALAVSLGLGLLGACGSDAAYERPRPAATRDVVFPAGQLVWAERSTIHVGDTTYDVGPELVQSMDWTPYGLYLEVTEDPIRGPFRDVFFDGTSMQRLPGVYTNLITSPDGRSAAWIDRDGPQRPAGRVAQAVVVDTASGETIFASADGMGGEEGDDLGARYENLPPAVTDLTDDRLVWRNSEGSGAFVTTDLDTGRSTTSERAPDLRPTSGFEFWSPDGRYRVSGNTTGRLRVHGHQPDFGHRWQTQGGWLDDHTMLVLAQDRYRFSYDPTVPDTTPGFLLACDLDAGTCRQLETVTGARDVVFPGVDVRY